MFCEEILHQIYSKYFEQKNGKIPFLDALSVRDNHLIETAVYRKKTNSDIYLNWNSFEPNSWEWATLRTNVTRTFEICSTNKFL